MQPVADAAGLAAFDPHWSLFWASHVRASHFAIWLPYLRRSAFRFVIMASADGFTDGVRDEVATLPNCTILEPYAEAIDWLRACPDFRGFIYVVSNMDNAAVMHEFPDAAHVWIGHGESAKKANAHRTASVYDSVLVGDYEAVGRYPRAIRRRVRDGACAIGVPIVEGLRADPWDLPRPIRSLVYAPTWEGRGPNVDYGSLTEAGVALLEAMPALAARGTTVLLRHHPGTGARQPELREILDQLRAAGAVRGESKAEDLMRADVIISDISGVTSEFLFTRKPAILPVSERLRDLVKGEDRIRAEYPWVYTWDVANEKLLDRLAALERADPLEPKRAAAAARLFRDHRTLEDATRSFDLALSSTRWRNGRIPVRIAYEARRRLVRAGFAHRPVRVRRADDGATGPRVSSAERERVEDASDRADAVDPGGGGVDGGSHGGG